MLALRWLLSWICWWLVSDAQELKHQTKTNGSSSSSAWLHSFTSAWSWWNTPKSTSNYFNFAFKKSLRCWDTEKKHVLFTTKLHGWPSFFGLFAQLSGSLLKVNEWFLPPWKVINCTRLMIFGFYWACLYAIMDVSAKCVFGILIVQSQGALEAITGGKNSFQNPKKFSTPFFLRKRTLSS